MVHANSLRVYYSQIEPFIKGKHKQILQALAELGEATLFEVSDYIGKAPHTISGRFTELSGRSEKEYGKPMIESAGYKKPNKYNNPCEVWKIKRYIKQGEQANLF